MTRAHVDAWADEYGIELILFDPPEIFDAAIVGIVTGYGQEPAVLYDLAVVRQGFVAAGMSEDEAEEWLEFNTLGAFVGPATPRFLAYPLPTGRPRPRRGRARRGSGPR